MHDIPYERYAGSVSAFGSYSLPSLALGRVDRRTIVILGFVAALLVCYAAGVIDLSGLSGGLILGAGPTVTELADEREKQQVALKAYMDEHVKKDKDGSPMLDERGKPLFDFDAEGVKKFRELNESLTAAVTAHKTALEMEQGYEIASEKHGVTVPTGRKITDGADLAEARPSLRLLARQKIKTQIEESAASGGLKLVRDAGSSFRGRAEIFEIADEDEADSLIEGTKATLLLTDIAPVADRTPAIVPSAQNRITVSDLMASGTTDSNVVEYYEETTFTNAAAETAENTAKPESTLDFTLRQDTVRKIATWIPISDEALADNRQLRGYVEGRLLYMVRQREEGQLITGNGTPPNIQGILNRSGIQTQAKGSDPVPDAFFKAFTKVQVTGDADPDGFVIHPNDWQDVRLLRTIDGIYIFGSPNEDVPVRMWGYPGRVTTGITENTGLVGAFRTYSQVWRRSGLTVVASTEHASYFIENKVALLAETRLALAVYRPAAFCSVTGI